MTYSVSEIRRWDARALGATSSSVASQATAVGESGRALADGATALDEGWAGRAADAVLDAADQEKSHINTLLDGVEVVGSVVRPPAGRDDVTQSVVDAHAEAIEGAVETVCSLDEYYGREIDAIAERLHRAIPDEVDRSPIPSAHASWPGRAVDAMTGAMSEGLPKLADELDPETRGRHMKNPAPEDFGRRTGSGLRALGRFAGPLGMGVTVYGGVEGYVRGETTAGEAAVETTGALVGGAGGGAAAGAVAGSFLGPFGAIVGAGVGAAVGSYLGQKAADGGYEAVMGNG